MDWMRRDGDAVSQLLQIADDDAGAGLEAGVDDPVLAVLRAEFDVGDVNLVVIACDVDLLNALHLLHGGLRDEDCVVDDRGLGAHAGELAGTKDVAGIGEGRGDANGAGLLVHLAVDEDDAASVREDGAVGERERERKFRRSVQEIAVAWFRSCLMSARYSESLMEK